MALCREPVALAGSMAGCFGWLDDLVISWLVGLLALVYDGQVFGIVVIQANGAAVSANLLTSSVGSLSRFVQ